MKIRVERLSSIAQSIDGDFPGEVVNHRCCRTERLRTIAPLLFLVVVLAGNAFANETSELPSKRWLIVVCGLPGDDGHREKLTTAVRKISAAADPIFQVENARLTVLAGDEQMVSDLQSDIPNAAVCTGESVAAVIDNVSKQIQPQDSCWVILLGHSQFYAGRSSFNVQDRDFDATDLAKWMKPIQCRERLYFLTMPVSGFWLKPLCGPQTVIIAATEAGAEYTATEMPYALADVLSGTQAKQALEDIDQDGQLSILDLYLAVNLEINARFKSLERLQTEHAQLDDNGDGMGKELQEPYLPVAAVEGETLPPEPVKTRLITVNSDGDYARSILITK